MKNRKGFTLTELVVVMVILLILMFGLAVKMGAFTDKATSTTILADFKATFDNIIKFEVLSENEIPSDDELVAHLTDFNGGTAPTITAGEATLTNGKKVYKFERLAKNAITFTSETALDSEQAVLYYLHEDGDDAGKLEIIFGTVASDNEWVPEDDLADPMNTTNFGTNKGKITTD